MARSVDDLALLLAAMVSDDPLDPLARPVGDRASLAQPAPADPAGLRVVFSDDLGFALLRLGQRPHLQILAHAQRTGNHRDPLQMQRQEVGVGLRTALLEGHLGHLGVGERSVEVVQTAPAGDIGNGFNIENEDWIHTQEGNTLEDK